MLTNLMYVTLHVTDQDRALSFYTERLGLEKRIDYPGPDGRFLTVGLPGSPVEFLLWSQAAAAGQPAEARPGAALGVILESDDLWADFKAFRERGVDFRGAEPEDYPFGVRIEAFDPDGNQISLRQRQAAGQA